MKLRTHLALLVIATALPIMVFAAGLIVYSARLEHGALVGSMRDTARALALALDRDIHDIETAVQAMASSRHLDEPRDLRRFYEDARVVSNSIGGWAVLSDISGRQLINTSRPFGDSLPLPTPASLAMMQSVAAQRQPFVSNVFIGTVSQRPAVIVAVPVVRHDRVLYVLDFPFEPARFTRLLQEAALSPDWMAIITDRAGGIVARVPEEDQTIGRPASSLWIVETRSAVDGSLKGPAFSDAQVYAAYRRSQPSGWVVGVAAPVALVERPFWRSLRTLAIGGAALVGLALALAYLLGRRIAEPIVALASSLRTAPGETSRQSTTSSVAEVNELRRALDDATERTRLLAAETMARQAAERRAQQGEAAQAAAEGANRAKDVFLATLSHELRTPLNAIAGWIQLMGSGQLDGAKTAQALQVVNRNAAHLTRLISDLLDVSGIIMGRLTLEIEVVDWPALVAGVVDSIRPSADEKGIALTSQLDPVAGPIRGDPARLQQVVTNILANAIKFTPNGGSVEVRLVRNGDARLSIIDTGRGISPELLPHVFDRFVQADPPETGSRTGLGLGLAIVRHLVEAHGGTVTAHSAGIGKGATITVDLPILITS